MTWTGQGTAAVLLLALGASCADEGNRQGLGASTQDAGKGDADARSGGTGWGGSEPDRTGEQSTRAGERSTGADELESGAGDRDAAAEGSRDGGAGAGSFEREAGSADAAAGGGESAPEGFELAPTVSRAFTPSEEDIFNPERGFYRYITLTTATNLASIAAQGYSLVYSYVRLDEYREGPIAESTLDAMNRGLEAVRAAGLKAIVRFAYNFGPYPESEPDASKAVILGHIGQLQPHLAANEDVIAQVQAGFIGAWGEWHTSTNDLLADPADRKQILEALLDAVPVTRGVALRYPAHKREMYGEPLAAGGAFNGSYAARAGHHNDCFLSSDTDVGTYPSARIEELKDYLAQDTAYVPMGGETCALHARSSCEIAQAEMAKLHFSYLNLDYHEDVIEHWDANGCLSAIRRGLGYRLQLVAAQVPAAVRPGGAFDLEVTLDNVGYAAPFNPRPVQVVLQGPETHRASVAELDVRRWLPGALIVVRLHVVLPVGIAPGDYSLALSLPDAAPALSERPEYAIRLANEGTWDAGANVLGTVEVSPSAAGDAHDDIAQLRATLR